MAGEFVCEIWGAKDAAFHCYYYHLPMTTCTRQPFLSLRPSLGSDTSHDVLLPAYIGDGMWTPALETC